jgi:hypothetical protein
MIAPPKPPAHDEFEALIKEARERQLRRRLLGAAGIAIAAAVALAIYAAVGSNSASGRTAEPRSVPVANACRVPSLSVQLLDMSNPTGLGRLLLRVTNESSNACVLSGFPVFRFYDRQGAIPFSYDRDGHVRTVVLRPQRAAYAVFSKFRCDIGVTRGATRGTIGLPHDPNTVGFRGGPAICKPGIAAEGRTVLVYPFEPTERLAYETSLAQH